MHLGTGCGFVPCMCCGLVVCRRGSSVIGGSREVSGLPHQRDGRRPVPQPLCRRTRSQSREVLLFPGEKVAPVAVHG